MAVILNIETSTKVCSVALAKDGKLLAALESNDENYTHSEKLTTYIQGVLSEAKIGLKEIDAIAVSKGPGSYTGLRIGIATAKGLCFALDKPLIGVETLKAMAHSVIAISAHSPSSTFFCPMLDARRMEVYCAIYDFSLNVARETAAEIIDENSFSDFFEKSKIFFFGDGAGKCKKKLSHPNAVFIDNIFPSAKNVALFSEDSFRKDKFENLAYFEPFYLKDFVSTKVQK